MTGFESRPSFSPAARLELSLLGPPRVLVDGEPAAGLGSQKVLALLAYLAVEGGRPHPRSALATLFWPDHLPEQALSNLRQTLSRLRRAIQDGARSSNCALPPSHLVVDARFVQFNGESDSWLDVAAFQALIAGAERHPHRRLEVCPTCMSLLARAVKLYRGEFLAGLHPAGSLTLDEWLLLWREQLERQACTALQGLSSSYLALGEFETAAGYARRWLHLDPWNEAAQRLLLRALALGEGRNTAFQQYHAFRQALAAELGVEPEDETQALAAQIEGGALADIQPARPPSRLPAPATPFVGRQTEIESITGDLAGRERRLLTLYGPGGCGKTRLALEVAAGQVPLWRDGVWFVPLVDVPSPEALVDALAAALDLQTRGQPLDARQLLDFLRPRELLLVLDGFEHLAAGAPLLEEMVHWAPEVRILVTSRARLGVRGEWAVPLGGLELPAGEMATVAEGQGSSAIQLFVQSACRVAPGFCLTAENLPHVARICRLVEGLPLGIELAAAWVRLYRCQQIADEIEGSLDFLHDRGIGRPQRHHSLRGTFETSYNLLSEAERTLFRRLSVFRGGFEVEAARQVADAGPRGLDSLLDKSLLQVSPAWRLDLHLTLREYAAEKLAERPEEEAVTRAQHSRFYLAFLREREGSTTGERGKEALDQIQGEIANVRAAWAWAVAQNEIETLGQAIPTLAYFYNRTGLFQEGETVFRQAAAHLFAAEHLLEASPALDSLGAVRLLARLRLEQARFLFGLGRYERIPEYTQVAITLAASDRDAIVESQANLIRGYVPLYQGEWRLAQACFERALSLAQAGLGSSPPLPDQQRISLREVEANSLNGLAIVAKRVGRSVQAGRYLEASLQAAREADDLAGQCRALNGLATLALRHGDFSQGVARYQEALACARACGDRRLEGQLLNNVGNSYLHLGMYTEAGAYYARSLEIQREIGAHQNEISPRLNLGLVRCYQGDPEAARSHLERAVYIALGVGDRRTLATAWLGLGHALLALDRLDPAGDAYGKAVALRRELDQAHRLPEPLAGLAQVSLAQGDLKGALSHVEEILDQLATGRAFEGAISPFQVYLTAYRVLEANQDDRAQGILALAHDLLQEQAASTKDPNLRSSFLENVTAHRELVQAFERMRAAE